MKREDIFYSLIIAFLMSLFMSGLVTVVNTGFDHGVLNRWMHAFSIALPGAFIALMVLKPVVKWLTHKINNKIIKR